MRYARPTMSRLAFAIALFAAPGLAAADPHQCTNIHVELTPTDSLQIVAWLEDSAGHYLDTIYITNKTGLYGLGNRPGRFDFNSGPVPNPATNVDDMWPYGRRITTFPVWAHRHGIKFPKVVFQTGTENDLSHGTNKCSREVLPYCRPVLANANPTTCGCTDPQIWDTGTCATVAYTDKGIFSDTETSDYPPRSDLMPTATIDSASVQMYAMMNPFDTISQATPVGGAHTEISYAAPITFQSGQYTLYVEVSKEFDFNASFNQALYPGPNVSYGNYGEPYRGQPSVVYAVPFTVGPTETIADALAYAGFGDPDGATGVLSPPDPAKITETTPGSGASRLELVSDGAGMYRVRVHAIPEMDFAAPDAPAALETMNLTQNAATLDFVAPGDDGRAGTVTSYEVRIRANDALTDANFDASMPTGVTVIPKPGGSIQSFDLAGLLPETDYWVGVRAFDDCHNPSTLAITQFRTADRVNGAVDACFVATAAFGSLMANDVEQLRHFRDSFLETSVLGELAVEAYYTFGPPVAGVIGTSELLRATARDGLAPLIAWVSALTF